MSVTEAAQRLGVSRQALSALLNGRAGISAEPDLRLAAALGTTPNFWVAPANPARPVGSATQHTTNEGQALSESDVTV